MFNLTEIANKMKLRKNEQGQGLVEYALILVLVAIVVIAILLTLGPQISGVYVKVVCGLQGGTCAGPYVYGKDIFTHAEACTQVGLKSGDTVYTYASRVPTQNGDEFWITSKAEAPKPNYLQGYVWGCP